MSVLPLPTPLRIGRPAVLRAALAAGSIVAVVVLLAMTAAPASMVEPALALLLRGMAAIKALLVLAAAAAVWWRFGSPVSRAAACGYLGGVWLALAATVSIAQLAHVGAAAVVFHVATLLLLVTAWRDRLVVARAPSVLKPFGRAPAD